MVDALFVVKKSVRRIFEHARKPKMRNGGELSRFISTLLFRIVQLIIEALLWLVYGRSTEQAPPIDNLILLDSATTLARKIRTGKVTSEEVVSSYINRIKAVNPLLNAVVDERFEDALEEAREVDKTIAAGLTSQDVMKKDTPFLGVPFTVEESIGLKGLSKTAGLLVRKGLVSEVDADVIMRIRRAGGIPLGVTNVSELGLFWECNNPVYGRTHNPYNVNRIAGGSAGGEGCLQATGGSAFGVAADFAGSIRLPAVFNGVFAHKPSKGIVPHGGYIPADPNRLAMLSVGAISRFGSDLLPIFKIMAPHHVIPLKLDEAVNINKLNFFFLEEDSEAFLANSVEPEIKDCFKKIITYLKKSHNIVANRLDMPLLQQSLSTLFTKLTSSDELLIPSLLADGQKCTVSIWKEMLKHPFGMSKYTLATLVAAVLEMFTNKPGNLDYERQMNDCEIMRSNLEQILGTNGVLIFPTHPTCAPFHVEPLFKTFNLSYAVIFNILDLPATHVPMGLNHLGLPIGVQIVGGKNQDRLTLAIAAELEKAFGGWVPFEIQV